MRPTDQEMIAAERIVYFSQIPREVHTTQDHMGSIRVTQEAEGERGNVDNSLSCHFFRKE